MFVIVDQASGAMASSPWNDPDILNEAWLNRLRDEGTIPMESHYSAGLGSLAIGTPESSNMLRGDDPNIQEGEAWFNVLRDDDDDGTMPLDSCYTSELNPLASGTPGTPNMPGQGFVNPEMLQLDSPFETPEHISVRPLMLPLNAPLATPERISANLDLLFPGTQDQEERSSVSDISEKYSLIGLIHELRHYFLRKILLKISLWKNLISS